MNVCAQSLCSNGVCRPLAIPGLLATRGTQSEQLNPGILYSFQVQTSPGSLTAFGIITDALSGLDEAGVPTVFDSHAYLGLYTDVDGQPGQLKASAAGGKVLSIAGGTSQIFAVSPPVFLTDSFYWIAVIVDQYAAIETVPDHQVSATMAPWTSDAAAFPPLPRDAPAATFSCQNLSMSEPPAEDCFARPALYMALSQ